MAFRLGHHRDVGMDVRKTFVGYGELVNRRHGVTANLGSLAMEAVSGPSRYICAKGGPYELVPHHLSCSLDSGVAQAVDGIEYALAP